MLTVFLLVVFLGVGAAMWFQGLWNNLVTLILLLLSGMLATNYYEPIAAYAVTQEASYTYLYDVIFFWLLFAVTFSILRAIADQLSHDRVKFMKPVELAGRSVMAIVVAWLFVCLTAFSLHLAPLPANSFGGAYQSPNDSTFLIFRPGQQWASFVRGWSGGSLKNRDNQFPPAVEFASKYHKRREQFEGESDFRVN